MMDREKIKEELNNIKNYPVSFGISVIISSLILWGIIDKLYSNQLENRDSTIKLMERTINDYKDKKFFIGETYYSKMTNQELKTKVLKKVSDLKDLHFKYADISRLEFENRIDNPPENAYKYDLNSPSRRFVKEYEIDHKMETVLLRETMLLRIPEDSGSFLPPTAYNYPTNGNLLVQIIDDFERISKLCFGDN